MQPPAIASTHQCCRHARLVATVVLQERVAVVGGVAGAGTLAAVAAVVRAAVLEAKAAVRAAGVAELVAAAGVVEMGATAVTTAVDAAVAMVVRMEMVAGKQVSLSSRAAIPHTPKKGRSSSKPK